MKNITVSSCSVQTLWRRLEDRIFAVPELQREFVWNARKASDLLDSIYRKMPIGSLTVWKAHGDYKGHLRHALHILPSYDTMNKSIWFLLDGQQRLSVLHRIRKGDTVVNDKGRSIDFGRIYFSLKPKKPEDGEDHQRSRFVKLVRPKPDVHMRVTDILNSSWQRTFKSLPKYKLKEIRECRNRIRQYRIPMVFVNTKDLDEVRESFIRINSAGTTISKADRAFARASDFDLRHLVRDAKHTWAHGFDRLPDETVLMALALIHDVHQVGDKAVQAAIKKIEKTVHAVGGKKAFMKRWTALRDSLGKAIDYLVGNFSVVNRAFLPSNNMVAVLAAFFYWNNRAQPNAVQKREIRKWFWATGVGTRYTGYGYNRNIIADVKFFKRLGKNRRGRFTLESRIDPTRIRTADYSRGTSITNTFFCLLISQSPRYLEHGDRIPVSAYSARSNRKEKHHIFARGLLRRNGFGQGDYNSICNICFLVSYENQSFGSKKPYKYLEPFRKQKSFTRAMKSHLIPSVPSSALWSTGIKRGYKAFLKQRCAVICKAFEKEAGIKLFRQD